MSDNPAVDRGSVGVSIHTTAPSGDLIGYGFAVYRDDRGPYFTSLNLTDPTATLSSNTIFTGIPAGPTEILLRTSFKPQLAVSNFSSKPAHVSVTMATTTAGKTKAEVAQTVLLAPRSSKTVTLPAHGDPGMANSIVVHSSLPPGEVVSQFVAWGDSLFRTVELQAKDGDSIQNGGGHPWTIEPGTDSTLLLFNHSTDGPKRFNVLVNSGKQLWQNNYTLASMETKAISIRDIIEKQIPDEKGVKIDKATITGQVGWWTRLPKWGKGRLMVSSPRDGLARSFSCGNCAALCNFGAYLDPYTSTLLGIDITGNLGNINVQQCLLTCTQQCGGTPQGPSSDATYTWTSTNTSIATVSSGGHAVLASFKGIAPGSANGHFVATDTQCTAVGNGPVTVKPTITSLVPARGLIGNKLPISVTLNGTGFGGANLSVSGGAGVSVTIVSHTATQIQADFTIAPTAPGGNSNITVTAGGEPSAPASFYVQIPKTLIRDTTYGTGGLGPLMTLTNGNVLDIFGDIVASGECGVYRNIGYLLVDQENPAQTIQGDYTLVEQFSNYTTSVSGLTIPPTQDNPIVYDMTRLGDTQLFAKRAPSCPGSNDHEGFDQSLTVQLDSSHSFGLSMTNHIDRGYYSGTATLNVTIKTP